MRKNKFADKEFQKKLETVVRYLAKFYQEKSKELKSEIVGFYYDGVWDKVKQYLSIKGLEEAKKVINMLNNHLVREYGLTIQGHPKARLIIKKAPQVHYFNEEQFDADQMEQIRLGFENELTKEQVLVYAKPEFNADQMEQIRLGFENELTMEQVLIYAKPKFDADQMEQIRLGFENGLTMKEVLVYAKPEIGHCEMEQIRFGFEYGLTKVVRWYR